MSTAMNVPVRPAPHSVAATISSFVPRAAPFGVALLAIATSWWLVTQRAVIGHDSVFHLMRVQALADALRDGSLYPRWFESFLFGYGYPMFQYYAPLTYYLAVVPHLLGVPVTVALNGVMVLGRLVGSLAVFGLANRMLGGRLAGCVAAAAFLCAPYQSVEIYIRGAIPEAMASNLVPAICLAVDLFVERQTRRRAAFCAATAAALLLTHQGTILPSASVVCAFAIYRLAIGRSNGRRAAEVVRSALLLSGVGLLSLCLAAFYWVPAIVSRSYIPLVSQPEAMASLLATLLPIGDVLQRTVLFSRDLPQALRFGLIYTAAAGLGALTLALTRNGWKSQVFFVTLLLTIAVAMSDLSTAFWSGLPFLAQMLFAFRLLMFSDLAGAILIGGIACLPWRRIRYAAAILAIAAVGATTFWTLSPWYSDVSPDNPNRASFARYELDGKYGQVGTTLPAQFLPVWVRVAPESLHTSRTSDKGHLATASPAETPDVGAAVRVQSRIGSGVDLQVDAERDFLLRYHRFYSPDVAVRVDGSAAAVEPDGELGVVSVPVPAGSHDVVLVSGDITEWRIAEWISAIALVCLSVLLAPVRVGNRFALVGGWAAAIAVPTVVLIAYNAVASSAPPVWPTDVRFDSGANLAGWSERVEQRDGRSIIRFGLYWFARRDIVDDEEVEIRIADAQGRVVADYSRSPRWGTMPTSTWRRGEFVIDEHEVALGPGTTPGDYRVEIGLRPIGSRVVSLREAGWFRLDSHVAGNVRPDLGSFGGGRIDLANGLSIREVQLDGHSAQGIVRLTPGGALRVSLLLQAGEEVRSDTAFSAFLVAADGSKIAISDTYPPQTLDFTAAWVRGETRTVNLVLPIPKDPGDGAYLLAIEAYDYLSGSRIPIVGGAAGNGESRVVVARAKALNPAAEDPERTTAVSFGDLARLEGFTASQESGVDGSRSLKLALYWRSLKATEKDYKVFVHLYDRSGKLVAQHDGMPLSGRFPTSAWEAGDRIRDEHSLDQIPAVKDDELRLVVGLYDPTTGVRVGTDAGGDSFQLVGPGYLGSSVASPSEMVRVRSRR